MTVLHGRRLIPALYLCQSGLFDRRLVIAVADGSVRQDIVRIILMKLRGTVFHRLVYIQYKGKLFILHLDGPHCPGCRHFIFRHDRRHIVPVKSDVISQQETVAHILMGRFR